ncbi:hypothetical protein [Nostoc favosum]|nr:hypothetical protein [Nostoc favosum]
MALSAVTMALSVETMALSVETMALSVETIALSVDTIISLASFFYGGGSFRIVRHRYLQNAIAQVDTLLTVLVIPLRIAIR